MLYVTVTENTTIDPTLPKQWCGPCGTQTARGLISRASIGCIHCNPTREVQRWTRGDACPAVADEPVGEVPDWMLE